MATATAKNENPTTRTKRKDLNFKQQLITKQYTFKGLSKELVFKINDLVKLMKNNDIQIKVENALTKFYINDVETWDPSEINVNRPTTIFKYFSTITSSILKETGVNILIDRNPAKRNRVISEYFILNKCFKSLSHLYNILQIDSSQALLELNRGIKELQQKIVDNMNDCINVFAKGNVRSENIEEYLKSSVGGAFCDIGVFPNIILKFIFVWKHIYHNISPLDLKLNQIYIDYLNGNLGVKQEVENFCRRFPNISEKEKNCCIRLYFTGILKTSKQLYNEKRSKEAENQGNRS